MNAHVDFELTARPLDADGVTVAVSAHDYAHHIVAALDSVYRQTHAALDLIVVNDHSTDDTASVVRHWMESHSGRFREVVLVSHDRRYGLAQARNTAFARAQNDWVFVLDADNELYPAAIERLRDGGMRAGAYAGYSLLETFGDEHSLGLSEVWNPAKLATGNYIDAMALIRRSAWRTVGGYSELTVPGLEDFDLWCKFVEHHLDAVFTPKILCRYRVHAGSMLRRTTNPKIDAL